VNWSEKRARDAGSTVRTTGRLPIATAIVSLPDVPASLEPVTWARSSPTARVGSPERYTPVSPGSGASLNGGDAQVVTATGSLVGEAGPCCAPPQAPQIAAKPAMTATRRMT